MKKFSIAAIVLTIALFTFNSNVNAGGKGQNYLVQGHVYVSVEKSPHKLGTPWGYQSTESFAHDIAVGYTDEVGIERYCGYFADETELRFWADSKNRKKRHYTGKGNCQTDSNQFVINGTKFEIRTEADIPVEPEPVDEPVDEPTDDLIDEESAPESAVASLSYVIDDAKTEAIDEPDPANCADYDTDYEELNLSLLQQFHNRSTGIKQIRIKGTGQFDWTLTRDADATVVLTLNDECDRTFEATDEIGYFDLPSKGYIGRRLTSYDFPEGVTYLGKLRITEESGRPTHYLYLNAVDQFDLVGTSVDVKIKIYQDGELVQAYHAVKTMSQKVK